ncbi:MAG: 4-(cytidine 5'-diphospho)-2-C-methyl-D-erythritol kinase [Prevotellaceae bacterium]|nr:4-(cytidine 5'-diphospho)-2-C-methyl-D-erythritol kinase [Prevotellaceae bacterium]
MLTFPCAKINLGLNITSEREDGYHNLETVFFPVPITDALEVKLMHNDFPSYEPCDLKITGNAVDCDEQNNLVVKAYKLLAQDFSLPRVHTHLVKRIPMQAGLGGGSADGAFMIRLLDERFRLNMGIAEMERYASRLGSDCAFFITAEPSFGTGRGEVLEPVQIVENNLQAFYIVIVKPAVAVSTREAFKQIVCRQPEHCCRDIIRQPVETWKAMLANDFEVPAFKQRPELAAIKQQLYNLGAVYAQMSGSGSAFFGLFRNEPQQVKETFPGCFTFTSKL